MEDVEEELSGKLIKLEEIKYTKGGVMDEEFVKRLKKKGTNYVHKIKEEVCNMNEGNVESRQANSAENNALDTATFTDNAVGLHMVTSLENCNIIHTFAPLNDKAAYTATSTNNTKHTSRHMPHPTTLTGNYELPNMLVEKDMPHTDTTTENIRHPVVSVERDKSHTFTSTGSDMFPHSLLPMHLLQQAGVPLQHSILSQHSIISQAIIPKWNRIPQTIKSSQNKRPHIVPRPENKMPNTVSFPKNKVNQHQLISVESISTPSASTSKNKVKKYRYQCLECDKRFYKKSHYDQHSRVHSKERNYECLECGRRFLDKSSLNYHAHTHSATKTVPCPLCDQYFTHKKVLKQHLKTHSGEKRHQCSECDRSFARRGHLLRHATVHTGLKNHSCPDCGKTFALKGTLDNHIRTHSGVKKFKCDICEKSFLLKVHLARHIANTHYGIPRKNSASGPRPLIIHCVSPGDTIPTVQQPVIGLNLEPPDLE